MKQLPILFAAALAVAACGSSDDDGTTYSSADGSVTVDGDDEDGTMTFRSNDGDAEAVVKTGSGSAENLPDGFTAYPGAKITMSVDGNQGGQTGGMVAMETDDTPDEVIAFYRQQMEDAGLDVHSEGNISGSHMIGARDAAENMGVNVIANGEGGATQVQIMFGMGD